MNKKYGCILLLACMLLCLSGCSPIGEKNGSTAIIYGVAAVFSLLLLIGCCMLMRKREKWFLLLFSSVFVINSSYLALSLSQSLDAALTANRFAYLGSVFLPLAMLMIILKACKFNHRPYLPFLLTIISLFVFLVAASPGILDIYYKEVSLSRIGGATVLEKVYGPWHCIYLFYLLAYFAATAAAVIYTGIKRRFDSAAHAIGLAAAVFINIGVWLLEQLVRIDFELLSISYIISELFLLMMYLLRVETQGHSLPADEKPISGEDAVFAAQCEYFASQLINLTPTERLVYSAYLNEKTSKEIMEEMNITQNTLKYHNKNIYSKLGVSSRKQLKEIAASLNKQV